MFFFSFFSAALHGERVLTASHYLSCFFTTLGKNNNDPPCKIENVLVLQLLFSLYLILLVTLNFLSFESEQYKRLNTYQGGKSCICKKACELLAGTFLVTDFQVQSFQFIPLNPTPPPFWVPYIYKRWGGGFGIPYSTEKFL